MMNDGMKNCLEMLSGHFYAKTTKLLFIVTLFLEKPNCQRVVLFEHAK